MRINNLMGVALLLFVLGWLSQAAQVVSHADVSYEIFPWLSQTEHLTLTGGMVVVIIILWLAFQGKDAALVESAKVVTKALEASAASNAELRQIIKESVDSKRELKEAIDLLRVSINQLPCTKGMQ